MLPGGQNVVMHWYVTDDMGNQNPPSGYNPHKTVFTRDDLEEAFYEGAACCVENSNSLHPGREYRLPDGSTIELDLRGNYTLKDDTAKVIRSSNTMRDFNEYFSASELLLTFLQDNPDSGIVDFVNYLIEQAAIADGEPVPPRISQLVPK